MELSKANVLPVLMAHADAVSQPGMAGASRVWYFSLEDPLRAWTREDAQRMCSLLPTLLGDDVAASTSEDVLEVLAQEGDEVGLVMRVEGSAHIARYCATESLHLVPHKWVQRMVVRNERLPDEMPLTVVSRVEESKEMTLGAEDSKEPDGWTDLPKNYILKKTFRFANDAAEYCVVFARYAKDAAYTMRDAGVTDADPVLLMEVRLLEAFSSAEADMMKVMGHVVHMMQILHQTYCPISRAKQAAVLAGYSRLIKPVLEPPRNFGRRGDHAPAPAPDRVFLAPKPITLERMHLADPDKGYGVQSILAGYAVTDKADGERMLLYLDERGEAFLINNTLEVRLAGVQATGGERMKNALVDGEYLPMYKRTDGAAADLFLAFDVYFLGGDSKMDLPLIDGARTSRNALLQDVCAKGLWTGKGLEIRAKKHVAADGAAMFQACKEILAAAADKPYDMDGLIFTPATPAVFGYYPGKPVRVPESMRWDRLLKWKPADMNSIDFLVRADGMRTDPGSGATRAAFKLYTGYNANRWDPIDVLEGVRLRYDYPYAKAWRAAGQVYKARLFEPLTAMEPGVGEAQVALRPDGSAAAASGERLEDNSIVEFAYDVDAAARGVPVSQRWVPMRVRGDKNRIYRTTGTISKTANDFSVAMSIWRSIHQPVTQAMICGDDPVADADVPEDVLERLLGKDDVYYANEVPRKHLLSLDMLTFHNRGILDMLYKRTGKRAGTGAAATAGIGTRGALLELACGMAGDMPRWMDASAPMAERRPYQFVLGVDISKDNIANPREGAYARMLKQNMVLKRRLAHEDAILHLNYVFAVGDCAKPLRTGAAADGLHKESKALLKYLYDGAGAPPYLKHIRGRASRGFDTVSCMFAIHYFFRAPEVLHGFLHNVADNLKPGGVFITTFMNGGAVHELMERTHGVAEGRKLAERIPVWAILRRYTGFGGAEAAGDAAGAGYFGKRVEVYLEKTARLHPEFLVHLPTLCEMAETHGLKLLETKGFSQTFTELRDAIQTRALQAMDKSGRAMSNTEGLASLVQRAEEHGLQLTELENAVVRMEDDPEQKEFSFLNQWAIFRKEA